MKFPFGLCMGRDEEHSQFPSEVLLLQLVGFEPFIVFPIYSQFQNYVNPHLFLIDWQMRGFQKNIRLGKMLVGLGQKLKTGGQV
jgi:hypothetical protein